MFMVVSSTYPFSFTDKNPLMNEVFPNFFHGTIATNWVLLWQSALGLTSFASLIPYFGVALLLVGRIVWLLRWRPSRTPAPSGEAVGARPVQPS
jgi:hypothetical protein